jgi:polysaccharide biosynthesis protein PslH
MMPNSSRELSDPLRNDGNSGSERETKSLAGKTVAIVHPAWHSCGTYQVIRSQIQSYKALGARVLSIAMMDDVTRTSEDGARWRDYKSQSKSLTADARFYTAPPLSGLFITGLLRQGWWPFLHGNHTKWLLELAKRAPLPEALEQEEIDLIHANHYFTMPLVDKLRSGRNIPVILESHDIQARQYDLRNHKHFTIPPHATFANMLADELDWVRKADISIHLNDEECQTFRNLLPNSHHELLYPAVQSAELSQNGDMLLVVASNNVANVNSVEWLLKEVLPLVSVTNISIIGNINVGIRQHNPKLHKQHCDLFVGQIDDVGGAYARAAAVLLPTTAGHGLSIKTVEALSSGARLIATSQAFRGMTIDFTALRNATIADDAKAFAEAIKAETSTQNRDNFSSQSDTRKIYEKTFSLSQYSKGLEIVALKALQIGRH